MELILIIKALAGTFVTVPSSAPIPQRGLHVPFTRVFIYAVCLSVHSPVYNTVYINYVYHYARGQQ